MVTKKSNLKRAVRLAKEINVALGKGTMRLGNDPYFEIVRIPTGSLTIDRITGGGFPLGRHVELYGDENTCKSYIMYSTMALSQRRGNLCALIDPEHAFDPAWFEHLGGNTEELMMLHPDNAEDAVKSMMLMFRSGEIEVVGVDSVAALLPLEELEKDPSEGQDRIASQARFMSRALRRLTTVNSKTLVLWTNQFRMRIGVAFGNPTTTPGGRALRFYDTTRIEMRQGERVKENRPKAKKGQLVKTPVTIGRWVQVLSEKEKSARPYQTGSFLFDTEAGEIDLASEIIQLGLEDGIINRAGNSFTYIDAENVEWKGTEKQFKKILKSNEELKDEIVGCITDMTLALAIAEET